jgi:hypothetical protein
MRTRSTRTSAWMWNARRSGPPGRERTEVTRASAAPKSASSSGGAERRDRPAPHRVDLRRDDRVEGRVAQGDQRMGAVALAPPRCEALPRLGHRAAVVHGGRAVEQGRTDGPAHHDGEPEDDEGTPAGLPDHWGGASIRCLARAGSMLE